MGLTEEKSSTLSPKHSNHAGPRIEATFLGWDLSSLALHTDVFPASLSQTTSADVNSRLLPGLARGLFHHRAKQPASKIPIASLHRIRPDITRTGRSDYAYCQRVHDSAPCYPDPVLHSTISLSSRSPSLVSALLCPIDITCDCVFLSLLFLHQSSLEIRLLDCEP